MDSLQKYYKLFLFITICVTFCASCGYPFNTRQARLARKKIKLEKKELTIESDTTQLVVEKVAPNTPPSTDSLPSVVASKKNKIKQNTPLGIPKVTKKDSLPPSPTLLSDSVDVIYLDSAEVAALDSLEPIARKVDTIVRFLSDSSSFIVFSKDSLNVPVQYEAVDSMVYDVIARKVYMYGQAQVFYEQYELKAGYIEFDFATNIAMATCLVDSSGKEVECPVFDDKQQSFSSRRIEFNFKTKKGKVYDASIAQGDGFLVSESTKFISKEGDSTGSTENIIYSQNCLYTTCDHEFPHFGIRASKAKIIPNKLIVVGPSFLEIMGSPTPLILPFGFFPLTKNKRSGLILSPDIDFSPTLGPGLKGNGFYLGLSDYWDLKVTGDFYMRGSLRAYVSSNYNIRYKGQGNVKLGYTRLEIDDPNTPDYSLQQSFNFSWTHSQSSKAHPNQSFSASVNFGTADYFRSTYNDAPNVLQATINSRVSYSKRFTGTPFSLSANLTHSQNTQTRKMTINFPVITLTMNQIFPLKRKNAVGRPKWYERIGFSYSMTASNRVVTSDTTFFTPAGFREAIDNMTYDVSHRPRLSMSFKLFKFINIRPSVNYSQNWYFYRNKQYLDHSPSINTNGDTTQYGSIQKYRDYGFFTTHSFSAGVNASTQIFATGTFNTLGLHQMRASFTPNVGLNWRPSYENSTEYYFDSVQYDSRYPDQLRQYNHFSYRPPLGKTASITYSITSRLEAKINKSNKDTLTKSAYKKIVLLPNIALSGNYNMAADSLHFSTINFNTYTTLFKKISVRFSAVFDPYAANSETNARINTFEYSVSKRLVRVTSMSFSASTSFTANDFKKIFAKKTNNNTPKDNDFNLIQNIGISYNFIINNKYIDGIDTSVVVANQISFNGTINLSKGWNIRIGRIGYDFNAKRITYPDFTFSRDLHCWSMGLSWQPERRTWSFFLKVKPGSLGFLNIPVRREFYDKF